MKYIVQGIVIGVFILLQNIINIKIPINRHYLLHGIKDDFSIEIKVIKEGAPAIVLQTFACPHKYTLNLYNIIL